MQADVSGLIIEICKTISSVPTLTLNMGAYEERGVVRTWDQSSRCARAQSCPLPPLAHTCPAMWDYPPLLLLLLLPLLHLLPGVLGQFEEEEKPYRGQLVGSLNSYHHQVNWDQQPKRSKLHLLLAFSTSTKYPKLRLIGIRMLHSEGLKP